MKKLLLVIISLFFLTSLCSAQIVYDTVSKVNVASGVVYKKLFAKSAPMTVHVLQVNLKNPAVKIETVKALNQLKMFKDNITLVGPMPTEALSVLSMTNSYAGHYVAAAINGDFFTDEEGRPYNIQIRNSEILQKPSTSAVIGFDQSNKPMVGRVNYDGQVMVKKNSKVFYDSSVVISGLNNWRMLDEMWLYNQYVGAEVPDSLPWTGQNQWGSEMIVEPVIPWVVNDTIKAVVRGIAQCCPDTVTRFQKGWAILSQHRNMDDWLCKMMKTGDTVKINLNIRPASGGTGLKKITEMIGGSPQIVKNGVNYVDQGYIDEGVVIDPTKPHHSKELHARTSVGISQDSTYLYMVTVEGELPAASKGMTLAQHADLLISLKVYNAINLNGGPMAEMVINDTLTSMPSLGAELPVSNGLMVVVNSANSVETGSMVPSFYKLYQNYPNPFNPSTSIRYTLTKTGFVSLKVFDMLGREIAALVNEEKQAGSYITNFSTANYNLPSGVYFYRLKTGSFVETKKMVLVK